MYNVYRNTSAFFTDMAGDRYREDTKDPTYSIFLFKITNVNKKKIFIKKTFLYDHLRTSIMSYDHYVCIVCK